MYPYRSKTLKQIYATQNTLFSQFLNKRPSNISVDDLKKSYKSKI